ncbi:hypothetical protein [Ferruginibacter sp.]|uniref:hypothetical protein n=1 Tax=Ferruginibacter sp. TaxID=1940288 RepID=UPI00265996BF|nr:hypothetical protein [Ferruginibacter sp.]
MIIVVLFLFSAANSYSQQLLPSDSLSLLLTLKENEMFAIITSSNTDAETLPAIF